MQANTGLQNPGTLPVVKLTLFLLLAPFAFFLPVASVGAEDPAPGDFEGAYVVGATSCVVVPIQMAFEVHWKGKKEPEIYFFDSGKPTDGKIVFTTDPAYNDGVVERFVFDDDSLSHGRFIDGKGRMTAVSR